MDARAVPGSPRPQGGAASARGKEEGQERHGAGQGGAGAAQVTLKTPLALLLIDFINDFEFEGGERLFPMALAAARATAGLRRRAARQGLPVVYCNDNFGRWRSDFRQLLDHCLRDGVRGRPIAELLKPGKDDYFVLKPKHSAFHSTSLDVLLPHLGVETLILTGVAGDNCVLMTAHDAYMHGYKLVVPEDCIASEPEEQNRFALAHMQKVCKAQITSSDHVDFGDQP